MIQYLTFNLLPYREIARAKQKREFNVLLMVFAAIAVVTLVLVIGYFKSQVSIQQSRNGKLQSAIAELDAEIKDVNDLEQEVQRFTARKQKIEELQYRRYLVAKMMDDLNEVVPQGVFLSSIKSQGADQYEFVANAPSFLQISNMMASMTSTHFFDTPVFLKSSFQEMKVRDKAGKEKKGPKIQQFTFTSKILSQMPKEEGNPMGGDI